MPVFFFSWKIFLKILKRLTLSALGCLGCERYKIQRTTVCIMERSVYLNYSDDVFQYSTLFRNPQTQNIYQRTVVRYTHTVRNYMKLNKILKMRHN